MAPAMRMWLLVLGLFGLGAESSAETAPSASADAIYAAFTINLTRFISWPPSALGASGSPFVIGTFPHDPINRELDAAAKGEAVNGHPVMTIRLRSMKDVEGCQVVFVSRGIANLNSVLSRVGKRPILTVSDADGFLGLGGDVLFVPQAQHTRLQISAENLRASGLEARSQLLRIAATP